MKGGWLTHSMPFLKRVLSLSPMIHSGMRLMNRTYQQVLNDTVDFAGQQFNRTASGTAVSPVSSSSPASAVLSSRETYDNAYFYILVVMLFYAFLATTLFKCLGSDEEKKDPYEEFISSGQTSTQKFNTGHMVEKFDFEEESSL